MQQLLFDVAGYKDNVFLVAAIGRKVQFWYREYGVVDPYSVVFNFETKQVDKVEFAECHEKDIYEDKEEIHLILDFMTLHFNVEGQVKNATGKMEEGGQPTRVDRHMRYVSCRERCGGVLCVSVLLALVMYFTIRMSEVDKE